MAQASDLVNSVAGLPVLEGTATSAVSSLVGDLIDSPAAIAASVGTWRLRDIAALAAPIVSAQNTYASFLETLAESDYALGLGTVADQSRLLSSTLGAVMDVTDFYSTEVITSGLSIDPDFLMVPAHLSAISSSLSGVFDESFESLQYPDHLPISVLAGQLHDCTLPVTHYAEFSRYFVPPAEPAESDEPFATEFDERLGIEELDALLYQLNPTFVAKRQGAWLALYGDNPDRLAQAAGSLRELLTMVLHRLTPDALPSDPKNKSATRKDRVRSIMRGSKSTTKHTLAVSDAIETGYDLLCKHLHTIQHDDLALRAYMYSVESTMLMMLSKPERRSS